MQPRYQPPQPYYRPPARPPARGLGKGCRTALFATLGVMLTFLLIAGGFAGYLLGNTLGTFDKYHSLPDLSGTLVTDADVQAVLPSTASPSCAPASQINQYCSWRVDESGGGLPDLTVSLFLSHGKLLKTGTMRAQGTYAESSKASDTNVRGVGDEARITDGTSTDERVFEFTDGNVDATFDYSTRDAEPADAAGGKVAALIAVGKAAASRLARSRK